MTEEFKEKNSVEPAETETHEGHVHDENCDHDHDHEGHVHDENCDHDHDHDHGTTVVMENEDGTSDEYPVVDEFEYNDAVYILVENADGTVTPLRQAGDEGELEFLTEEEFNEVANAYNEFMDEYSDEDEDEDDLEDSEDEDAEEEK